MKRHWRKIIGAILLLALSWYGYGKLSDRSLRQSVEKTRRELRQQGFKTDYEEFHLSLAPEALARSAILTQAGVSVQGARYAGQMQLMMPISTNVAFALSPVETITGYEITNLWPLAKAELDFRKPELDAACTVLATSSVPIEVVFWPSGGSRMPGLAHMKALALGLSQRAVLAMHEHDTNAVYTNLFALTRIVTGWKPGSIQISHLVRFAVTQIAERTIWELMQTDGPTEEQLAALQHEWETAKFFDGLPETMEFECANRLAICEDIRSQSFSQYSGSGSILKDIFNSPGQTISQLRWTIPAYLDHNRYRNRGVFEDEQALMLYYRNGKEAVAQAIRCSTWNEMRATRAVTNTTPFVPASRSRMSLLATMNSIATNPGQNILSRAAETEARRRMIVTALALERFALREHKYPEALAQIVPEFLPAVTIDFMDGKELRYELLKGGRYVMYSVGLDCEDNGGASWIQRGGMGNFVARQKVSADIVWPRVANQDDVDAFEKAQEEEQKKFETRQSNFSPEATAAQRAFEERYGPSSKTSPAGEDQ